MSSPSIMSFESEFSSESVKPKKVVFPPPPPTTNRMTPQQRSQLRRSADKLRRVLGATPRLIDSTHDEEPVHHRVQFPVSRMRPRASIESISSIESSSSSDFPSSSCSESTLLNSPSSSLRSKRSSGSLKNTESWPSKRPPMLRLSASPSRLEPIPASPAVASSPQSAHSRSSSMDSEEENVFTMKAAPPSSDYSPTTPTFAIMSANAERRRKMERLRRKLGDDVPTHLVFPVADLDDLAEESSDSDYASSPAEPASPASDASSPTSFDSDRVSSPGGGRRRLSKKNRIHSTRDSIASVTPHKATRKPRSPIPSEFLPAAPTFLLSDTPSTFISDIRDHNDQLFVIMESPNEYGSSGDEKVETQSQASDSADSIWFDDEEEQDYFDEEDCREIQEEEDEFNFQLHLWDIRRGYGGWTEAKM